MALLSRADVISALARLGELANADGEQIELLVVGGSVMVMEFSARPSTRDVDAIIVNAIDPQLVRKYAGVVAVERGWPTDWLNDAAKGFLTGAVTPTPLFQATGIQVFRPSIAQLLAMKLCAWRDDVDIADAERLLKEMLTDRNATWLAVQPFLQPGRELKARYAFDDLWDARQ